MYRPAMATWFQSIAKRIPGHSIPTREEIDLAMALTGHASCEGLSLTYDAAHALVWARAQKTQAVVDGGLPQELLAAITWDRTMVAPDAARLTELARDPRLPATAFAELAAMPRQTSYLLLEQPSSADPSTFVTGAWLIRDETEAQEPVVRLLLDLVVDGHAVRDILMDFTLDSFEIAVERQIDRIAKEQAWHSVPGPQPRIENMRSHFMAAKPVIGAFYDTFVRNRGALETAAGSSRPDELGFTLLEMAPAARGRAGSQMAAGMYH